MAFPLAEKWETPRKKMSREKKKKKKEQEQEKTGR
jgi:hypothetical protein